MLKTTMDQMDQTSWLWKKKSTEKTLLSDKANSSLSANKETTEVKELLAEKAGLNRDLKTLSDKLSFALSECSAKDNMAKKQVKIAQEAITGWEKAESEVVSLKQELDNVLQQKAASEERLGHLEAALKECMEQLRFVHEEQEKRVHGAVLKATEEFEKTRILSDENLSEAVKRLAKLDAEKTHLSKALSAKNKVIEDLNKYRTQVEADFNALLLRVESTEKENASLKYEVRVLEKEHDIRNEESEFNRRMAEVTQKQHQENNKKITKLESECQRLRLLLRKRLPGPAALAKMKNEVEMLGKDRVETRRRKSNPSLVSSMNIHVDVLSDTPSNRVSSLAEQLHIIEEENRVLKDALQRKSNELHFSRAMSVRTPSRLSRAGQIDKSLEGQRTSESDHLHFFPEHSLATSSDIGSDDKVSCGESWASGLISEVEHIKNEKELGTLSQRSMGTSAMNLMADFAEMEKLAVVSVDYPAGSSRHSSAGGNEIIISSGISSGRHSSPSAGRDMVPVFDFHSVSLISGQEIRSDNLADNRVPGNLEDVLKMLLEHCHFSKRNPHEVLEDINTALSHCHSSKTGGSINFNDASNSHKVNEHDFSVSPCKSLNLDAPHASNGNDISEKRESDQIFQSSVSMAVQKILELLEGINMPSNDNCVSESLPWKENKLFSATNSETATGYVVRVFQWKAAELTAILQQFRQTCNYLLNGTSDLEQLIQHVTSTFEWVMNHCFSVQDVWSMKEAIQNHLDWDESRSESEIDSVLANHLPESNQLHIKRVEIPYHRMVSPLGKHNISLKSEQDVKEGCKRFNVESAKKEPLLVDLEDMPQPDSSYFRIERPESKVVIETLQSEMEIMEQLKGKEKDQNEKQKIRKEDLETPLMETSLEEGKSFQNISHLGNELENNKQYCREPEETCHDVIEPQSMTSKEVPVTRKQRDDQLRTDLEITAASQKLAECQETIQNLGKQLKALASPIDAVLFDKVISTPSDAGGTNVTTLRRNTSMRSSLLDKMQAENNDQIDAFSAINKDTQNVKDNRSASVVKVVEPWGKLNDLNENNLLQGEDKIAIASMAIIPIKKKGGKSFLRKLFWLKKKSNSKNASYS